MKTIRIKHTYIEVSLDEQRTDFIDTQSDPYEVFTRKVENLAQLLGCNEAEAERLILDRL